MTDSDTSVEDFNITEIDLDRVTHDDLGRVYYNEDVNLPSVSTVLNVRPVPEALQRYKEKQKKKEGYTDFYLDQGTLAHYELQNDLVDEELWTSDEEDSEQTLKQHQEYWDRYQRNIDWLKDTWEFVKDLCDIRPENMLAVEHFVANFEVGYAGQLDLLWVDDNGDVVLGDIKTSKDVYSKYLYQAVAYDHALDITVDRYEILRMCPDQQVWEISRSDEWIEDPDDLWEEFKGYREEIEEERLEEIREKATKKH